MEGGAALRDSTRNSVSSDDTAMPMSSPTLSEAGEKHDADNAVDAHGRTSAAHGSAWVRCGPANSAAQPHERCGVDGWSMVGDNGYEYGADDCDLDWGMASGSNLGACRVLHDSCGDNHLNAPWEPRSDVALGDAPKWGCH
ncbi:hypothetical protein GUJ93_ZPchr0006g45860 [Zizania palustris]|uniref:Uncharacterized protein n=1 Tax=Zizania palustris TaxID=103762 RepID=A0A8J5T224_ZIZPA|nr:hypothetical protein GUJ93_ZPchr0006g45860 [Zizania palustris]